MAGREVLTQQLVTGGGTERVTQDDTRLAGVGWSVDDAGPRHGGASPRHLVLWTVGVDILSRGLACCLGFLCSRKLA